MKTEMRRGWMVACALAIAWFAIWKLDRLRAPSSSPTVPILVARPATADPKSPGPVPLAGQAATASVTKEPLNAQPEPHYTIHVLDGDTREAVAHAIVQSVSLEAGEWWREDEDAAFATSARVATTDESGRVRIPVDGGGIIVRAAEGSRFGDWMFEADSALEDSLQFLIWPDFDVSVQICDRAGRRIGEVPVALWTVVNGHRSRESTATTNGAGVAVFRHVGQRMEQGDELRRDHKVVDVRWEVGLDLGAATTNSAIVARRAPPDRPIELTLPETGTVVIEGVDATGDRVAIEGTGGVTLATDSQRDAEIRSRWQDHDYDFEIDEHAVRGRLEDGRLVIPRIPIGLGLLAFAQRNGASRFFGTSVTAPTKDGEVVTCRVVFGADGLLFRGRAVDEQRRPLPGSTLTSWIVAVNGPDEEASFDGPEAVYDGLGTITTDRDGRFVIDGGDGRCNWFRADRFMLTMSRNRPEAREGAVELPRSIGARVVELGDLTLSPAPLIASGTVVDERGDPVCGCRVDGPTWKSIDSCVHTMTDDHGRFELRGILFDKDLELSFRAALRPDKTLWPVDPGARDLVVRLPRSGGLKARFRMPMGAPKSTLSISLHHDEDGSDGAFDNCSTGVDSDEEFVDVGRWPGRWTMTVIGGGCEPLKLSGIVIHGGEITDLGEIAIDADTTLIRLAVRSAATGEPLDGAYLVRPRGTGKIDQLFADAPFGFDGPRHLAGGKIELYAKEQAVDIVVISLGHRAEVVTAHAGDQETQLRQALRVPLRIPEFAGQPPPPSELRLAVSLGGESSFPLRIAAPELEHVSWSTPFDRNGRAELVLPTTGSFPVQWIVVTPRDHGSNSISFNGRERTIEVDDDDDSAELLLHPDFDTSKAPEDHR